MGKPIERLLCFMGIMLLTPIFYPEQEKELRDVVSSKKTGYLTVCALRLLYSVITLSVLVVLFVCLLKAGESDVTDTHILGGLTTALFLGSIGFFIAGISDNTTLGYMAAMLYYLANYGLKDKLGHFYLFHMSAGNFEEKWWLLPGALLLIFLTFLWKWWSFRH